MSRPLSVPSRRRVGGLRTLLDAARTHSGPADDARTTREATGRFLTAPAGDLPRYEDVTRALFAGDRLQFSALTEDWPPDVRDHACAMASGAFIESRFGES